MGNKRQGGITPGITSLAVILMVLCMTVFAALSYITAKGEHNLAIKSAAAMREYYTNDLACAKAAQQILDAYGQGLAPREIAQQWELEYSETPYGEDIAFYSAAGDGQRLDVTIHFAGGSTLITRWQQVRTGEWEPDDSLNVWDGE